MTSSIVIIGCFDTKGEVFAHLRQCILARNEPVLTINTGVLGTTELFPVDYEADAVATAANHSLPDLRESGDRGWAIDVMSRGAATLVGQLVAAGIVKGIVGMGGGGGTFIALSAMQEVPFGIPKLCLSTLATKDVSRQIGSKDVVLMASVVDVACLNSLIVPLIEQAAAAICAMAAIRPTTEDQSAGRIAVSMFGNTTPCVDACTDLLTRQGYEVLAFHANGTGGRTMESLIREGFFQAVLDITTTELADELGGGICSAGPDRLTAAATMGIPQVVVPGCLDMVNFGHADTVPSYYQHRQLYSWSPAVTLMRTNEAENRELGSQLAQKVNQSTGPVLVILPLAGLSQLDSAGNPFYQPNVDHMLFRAIKDHLSPAVPVVEADAHINDPAFAALLVDSLVTMLHSKRNMHTNAQYNA